MQQQNVLSHFSTQLAGRELLYSGISVVNSTEFSPPSALVTELMKVDSTNTRVDKITSTIEQFNKFSEVVISQPTEADYILPATQFVLPEKYKMLDVISYLDAVFELDISGLPEHECLEYAVRYKTERDWFEARGKFELLKTLIYIIDVFEINQVVWGVGRGSSVSSYILYLIGVHEVHPIKYKLDYREFLRD